MNYKERVNLEPKRSMTPVNVLGRILEGKAQKAFLDRSGTKLMSEFKSMLADLDACTTIEQLQLVARANGMEVTQEDLDTAAQLSGE